MRHSARWRRTVAPTHWYAGYESQSDNILDVDVTGAVTSLDFWTWHFIEEGWDFGFVEALVNGQWVTVPLVDDSGTVVTTNDDPHGNNTEGNGITGTSGGEYFVDEPQYVHYTAQLPAGATDVRFRYSTDAAYLDTGWFVDDVRVNGAPATLLSPSGDWFETTGVQDNNWTVQVVANCDLTPGSRHRSRSSTVQGTSSTGSRGTRSLRAASTPSAPTGRTATSPCSSRTSPQVTSRCWTPTTRCA